MQCKKMDKEATEGCMNAAKEQFKKCMEACMKRHFDDRMKDLLTSTATTSTTTVTTTTAASQSAGSKST